MSNQRLIHYANRPLALGCIYSQTQEPKVPEEIAGKPRGLWVSVEGEDDWKSWCEAESFRNVSAQVANLIELKKNANILRLSSAREIDLFTIQFENLDYMKQVPQCNWRGHAIRWWDVAKEYQGIIIAPYCWERRMTSHTFWYYGWDCASGVIWDASAIESATVLVPETIVGHYETTFR